MVTKHKPIDKDSCVGFISCLLFMVTVHQFLALKHLETMALSTQYSLFFLKHLLSISPPHSNSFRSSTTTTFFTVVSAVSTPRSTTNSYDFPLTPTPPKCYCFPPLTPQHYYGFPSPMRFHRKQEAQRSSPMLLM